MSEPPLAVSRLSVLFGSSRGSARVVDRISFTLQPGEIVGLVGESGCGKSVTAAALMGMVEGPAARVEAESIQLAGIEVSKLDEAGLRRIRGSEISVIFQEPLTALDPVFTIGSQIASVVRRHRGQNRKKARAFAVQMLKRVGIADADRISRSYPHQLSGGMRQRVMIGMAMACQPKVLIADEPTTALDVTTQALVLEQIANLARSSGTAVLLITHDLGVVAQSCDRAMVMYCGRIVEEASVTGLFAKPRHPYTAGLLAAVPRISADRFEPVQDIPGVVPQTFMLPPGCHFADRCTRSDHLCREQVPMLDDAGNGGHRFACHHPVGHRT